MSELGDCMVIDMLEGLDELAAGDRHRGWEFVRALTAAFGRPVVEGDGVDPALVRVGEEQIGFALPAALREAYLLFGGRRDLTAGQDSLVPSQSLEVAADGVLVFRVEAQNCARWGVSGKDSGQDDPPVLVNSGDGWVPYSDRLSLALVEMVMSEAMFSADQRDVDHRELDETANALVCAAYEPLPLPVFPFWAGMDGPGVRWFAGPDVLLRNDGETWLWVHGRTPEAVQAVRERVSGEWLMVVDDDEEFDG